MKKRALLKIKLGIAALILAAQVGIPAALAQAQAPVLNSVEASLAGTSVKLTLKGSGFTSFNTVTVAGPSGQKSLNAASATGQAVAVTLTAPQTGSHQVTLANSHGQASNTLEAAIASSVAAPSSAPQLGTAFSSPIQTAQSVKLPQPKNFVGGPIALPRATPSSTPTITCPVNFLICRKATHIYTALGDSLGVGLFGFGGYVHQYEEHIEQDKSLTVDLKNLSQAGMTSTQLRAALELDPRTQQLIQQADFVTFNIGGNDLRLARDRYKQGNCGGEDNQDCLRQTLATFAENWRAVAETVMSLRKSPQVVVRSLDIYYPYVNEDVNSDSWPNDNGATDYQVFVPYMDQANQHVAATLAEHAIPMARVSEVFNGADTTIDPHDLGLISFDGYHPNTRGHRIIADLLRQLGY